MRSRRDALTRDLFEIPSPTATTPGCLDLDVPLRLALSDALKNADGDRYDVAAEMSRLTGRDISKYMLDAYTAESRSGHNIPVRYAAAFEQATDSYCITNLMAKVRGGRVLLGAEALLAELVKIERMESDLKDQKKAVKKILESRK